MKKCSNLSMFKSQWDETKAKWGRWDLNPGFRLFRRREGVPPNPKPEGCQATPRPLSYKGL